MYKDRRHRLYFPVVVLLDTGRTATCERTIPTNSKGVHFCESELSDQTKRSTSPDKQIPCAVRLYCCWCDRQKLTECWWTHNVKVSKTARTRVARIWIWVGCIIISSRAVCVVQFDNLCWKCDRKVQLLQVLKQCQ